MPKKTRAKRLIDAGKNYSLEKREEEIIPGLTVEARNRILELIEGFGQNDFLDLEDPMAPVAYTYSIIARVEEEYANLKDFFNRKQDRKQKLSKADHIDIIAQLKKLANISATLMKQMEQSQKIQESKQRQQIMSMPIAEHAAIMEVIMSSFSTSLVQEGFTEDVRLRVFKRFDKLQKNFPIIEADLDKLRLRLFGKSDNMLIDATSIIVEEEAPETTVKKMKRLLVDNAPD